MGKPTYFFILIITILLLTLNPTDSLAKGMAGSYIISGVAVTKRGDTLRNEQLLMYFKDKVDTLNTDWNGYYQATISWETPCPSGLKPSQINHLTKELNPKYIYFSFKNNKTKIKNEWKHFIHEGFNNQENQMKNKNLIFSIIAPFQNENIFIKLPNTYFIYAGYDNIIKVSFNKKSVKKLFLNCDNCDTIKPYRINDNEWIIRGVKVGKLNIKAKNHKEEVVALETFYVLPPPEPDVLLDGKGAESLIVKIPSQIELKVPPSIPLRITYGILKWQAKVDGQIFSGIGKYFNKEFIDYISAKRSGTILFKINYNDSFRKNEVIEIFQYSFE